MSYHDIISICDQLISRYNIDMLSTELTGNKKPSEINLYANDNEIHTFATQYKLTFERVSNQESNDGIFNEVINVFRLMPEMFIYSSAYVSIMLRPYDIHTLTDYIQLHSCEKSKNIFHSITDKRIHIKDIYDLECKKYTYPRFNIVQIPNDVLESKITKYDESKKVCIINRKSGFGEGFQRTSLANAKKIFIENEWLHFTYMIKPYDSNPFQRKHRSISTLRIFTLCQGKHPLLHAALIIHPPSTSDISNDMNNDYELLDKKQIQIDWVQTAINISLEYHIKYITSKYFLVGWDFAYHPERPIFIEANLQCSYSRYVDKIKHPYTTNQILSYLRNNFD